MRWKKGRRSQNIEDRRGQRPRMGASRGIKLGGGMGILLLLVVLIFGGDPIQLLGMLGAGGGSPMPGQRSSSPIGAPASDEEAQFVSSVLGFTEDTWSELFRRGGQTYQPPKLVLYSGSTTTACGYGSGASGPFYCPGDRKVYIDLDFFRELNRLGAPGDFAQAYVIAHEVAHHVQNLLGTMQKVDRLRRSTGQADANALSVRLELQADCYAGIWTHHAQKAFEILETGDIKEGLGAAGAVGDDRLQRMSGRGVHPESFTHGSSKQRVKWFNTGLETGDIAACNTFGADAHGV
jgi:predicted metalloprotease